MVRKGLMNKRTVFAILMIALLLIVFVKNYQKTHSGKILGAKTAASDQTIKIGAIYDLSGVSADLGKAFEEGTQIAADEINSGGGINGHPVEVIYEDDPDQAAKPAVNAAQKLINVDKVSGILDISYGGLAGIQPLAEQKQVPTLDVIDSSDRIGSLGDWIFGVGVYDDGQGQVVAEHAVNNLKITKAAILTGKEEYLLTVSGAFEKRFTELGGQITDREEFEVGTTDFRTQMAKIKQSGAEAIFFAHLGEGGYGIKQATELGFNGYFLGTDPMSIADVKRIAGSDLNNRTFFALWRNFDQLTPQQQQFADVYQTKFGQKPGDYMFYNVMGYDGLKVLAEAIKNSDLTGAGIKNALYNIKNFPGLSGPITIDSTGINRDSKASIVMYNDKGKIVRYQK